ncbi:hypothetical protein ABGB12_34045 [Actinocorallia sp. B10E7]|uniref:hypothetical protein n=1 Tax=Actinocorallia sp. B10E7 TaxID=3153558 RepID=UPI00325F8319
MADPVILILGIVLRVLLMVGYGVLVILPQLVWTQLHNVWRTFGRATPTPPDPHSDPAIPAYLRVIALRDLRAVWWDGLDRHERPMGDAKRFLLGESGRTAILLNSAFMATAAAAVLAATALSILPLLLTFVLWVLCCALWTLWWALWATVARLTRVRGGPSPCVYSDCGRAIVRPARLCPTCHARHRELGPGRYGVLYRRCRCGTRLPAVLGLRRLQAHCPHCDKPLPAGYERSRVVVLAGGSNALRGAVHRQGLAEMGAAPGSEPPLVRARGRSLLLFDPAGDAFGDQESVAALDILRHADALMFVVDEPTANSADVRALTRVLHVVAALPARRRPHRLALLYTGASRGDDNVLAKLEADGGGHLLRALDTSGIPVRCIPAQALGRTLWWLAGMTGAPGSGELVAPPPLHRPVRTANRLPRHRAVRLGLLLAQAAGYLVVPMALLLLQARLLPSDAFFGLPGAYDKWRHPLTGTVHQIDLTAMARPDWPKISASHSDPGHPPSAALPAHKGYWSFMGSTQSEHWLRVDLGMPLPLSEVSVNFVPDSVKSVFSPSVGVVGQIGADIIRAPDRRQWREHKKDDGSFLGKIYGYDIPFAKTVDSIRIGVGSRLFGKPDENRQLRLREFAIRWTSSDALRLRPADGGRITVENATARDLAITIRPPVLPPGWHAAFVGSPPSVLRAHDTYEARWLITAPKGATGRVPIAYAVDATEDGRTVTSRCLALLTPLLAAEQLC